MAKRKGLPSHIVKKYGMTKKAWQVFKSGKSTRSAPKKRAKTKTKRRKRTMPKKKVHRRKKPKLTLTKVLMGGFGVVIADQVADQMLTKFNIGVSDDIVKLGIGLYAAKRGGMIGETGKALAYINASRLLSNINIGNIFSGLGGTTTNGTTGDGW